MRPGNSAAEMVNVLINPIFVMVDIIVLIVVTKICVILQVRFQLPSEVLSVLRSCCDVCHFLRAPLSKENPN